MLREDENSGISQDARGWKAPNTPDERTSETIGDLPTLEQKLKNLEARRESARKQAQEFSQREYSQQPHFHGILPGSPDALMLKDSRRASQSLMKDARAEVERLGEEIGGVLMEINRLKGKE